MFGNTNAVSVLAVSSLFFGHLSESLAIGRRDVSAAVRRSASKMKRQSGAPGLSQPIWLGDDGLHYFTNVSVGTPPQQLTLALTTEGTTWAPTLPAGVSVRSFCSMSEYTAACQYANVSGFYTIPGSVTYSPTGDYQTLQVGGKNKINGIRALENLQMGNNMLANVGIAIANIWDSAPQLSLSPVQGNNSGPQLLSVLEQAKYANSLTYALSFGSADSKGDVNNATGRITFGAIDETQFFGELSSFDAGNGSVAGVVPVSNLYWINGEKTNASVVANDTEAGDLGVGQIAFTPYLWLQDSMFEIIMSLFSDVEKVEDSDAYARNCSAPLSDLDIQSIQMSIDGTVVTIPVEHLFVTRDSPDGNCTVAIRPMSKYSANTTADYILGFPFLRSAYTVLDYTNQQTLVAPRRVVFSDDEDSLIPVGVNGAAITASGPASSGTVAPVATTITAAFALETPSSPTSSDGPSTTSSGPKTTTTNYIYNPPPNGPNVGAIVGGVVGAIVIIAILIVIYPLKKMHDTKVLARRRRAQRAAERAAGSSPTAMSPVEDVASRDGADDNDDDGKDAEALATAIAISESKKEAARTGPEAGRDSFTVNVTELNRDSSNLSSNLGDYPAERRSQDVKSVETSNTFGESEKHGEPRTTQ